MNPPQTQTTPQNAASQANHDDTKGYIVKVLRLFHRPTDQHRAICISTSVSTPAKDNDQWRDAFFDSVEAAASYAARHTPQCNVYFTPGHLPTGTRTRKGAGLGGRSLWVDIDTKDVGGTMEDARAAAGMIILKIGLRPTVLVDTGRGYHLHFIWDEPVELARWQSLAGRLVAACRKHGIAIDADCTLDEERVMRLPLSYNFKLDRESNPPKPMSRPVTVFSKGVLFDVADIEKALDGYACTPKRSSGPSSSIQFTLDDPNAVARRCLQVRRSLNDHGRGDSEPLWHALAGIARGCSNSWPFFKALSDGHPEFNEVRAQAKLERAIVPTCRWVDEKRPGICGGCPRWALNTSPVDGKPILTEAQQTARDSWANNLIHCYESVLAFHGHAAAWSALVAFIAEARADYADEVQHATGKVMARAKKHWSQVDPLQVSTAMGMDATAAARFLARLGTSSAAAGPSTTPVDGLRQRNY